MKISPELLKLAADAERELNDSYTEIDRVAYANTEKVLDAFREARVSDAMFAPSSGYGYGDRGREVLDEVWARVFGCESAFVRHNIVNGTHALTIALFGLLRPGDTLLSVTGKPYDTLDKVIGLTGDGSGDGSLCDFGVNYRETALDEAFLPALDKSVKVVYIQRSKGYMDRRSLSAREISSMTAAVRALSDAYVVVDNCYGEFAEENEPEADLLVGSLIKNPGGGMAESGGYIAGTKRAVELAGYRLTTVGTGTEVGASLGNTKNMFKGLFFAPHVTAQALKTALFAAYIFEKIGLEAGPRWNSGKRYDIIQTVKTGSPERLCALCRGIQAASPVDAFAAPEPWDMPGYSDKVIMAAGTFTQGASIELSADGPLRPPYTAFIQGALTYESGRLGILNAAQEVLRCV